MKIGFDNEKYQTIQSEHIKERISQFDGKLYLELGGKLFDDHHASRVLPGFQPDSKLRMFQKISDSIEIVIVISAADIEKNKKRADLGITYDEDVLRLRGEFQNRGFMVGSVVITHYNGQPAAIAFKQRLERDDIKTYCHYLIEGYPHNVALIASDEGFGKNDYVETERPLVIVTAPGPGSGKMAVCLSQLYNENKRGIRAGYAKFETFPVWNLPLKHPVNIAYEAATADLNDVNMIDPFHLDAYNKIAINYNRDIEIYPVLNALFEGIYGNNPYKSPTDMGVNMAGYAIGRNMSRKKGFNLIYFYIVTAGGIRSAYIAGSGIWGKLQRINLMECLSNIVLNYMLGVYWGIMGIIIASILTVLIFSIYGNSIVLIKEYFRTEMSVYFYELTKQNFIGLSFVLLAWWASYVWGASYDWKIMIKIGLTILGCFVAILMLDSKYKRQVKWVRAIVR